MSLPTPNIVDITGVSSSTLQVGIAGPVVKNTGSAFALRNSTDAADVALTASAISLSATSNQIILNSAASESGSFWKTVVKNAASGQTADVLFALPSSNGTTGQFLQTDGSGNLSYASAGST